MIMNLRKLTNELIGQCCMYPKWTSEDVREGNCKLSQCHTSITKEAAFHRDIADVMRDIFCPSGVSDTCYIAHSAVYVEGVWFLLKDLCWLWDIWQTRLGYYMKEDRGLYYRPLDSPLRGLTDIEGLRPYIDQCLQDTWDNFIALKQ